MQPYRYRAVWLSDVHLGFKDCKVQFLLDFLEVVECERLYLVGDLIDFWSLRKGGRWPAGHGRVLKSLLAKAKQGVRVIYIPGNHDEMFARLSRAAEVAGVRTDGARYEHQHRRWPPFSGDPWRRTRQRDQATVARLIAHLRRLDV
jgi:UDP-2,3-diacylglucosamine pyrophosphatase LpxH